jgi:hypothetical protein
LRIILEKMLYFGFVIIFFLILLNVTGILFENFIPWTFKTDLIFLVFGMPLITILSFILSSLTFNFIRESK